MALTISLEEAAELIGGVDSAGVRRLIRTGKLSGFQLGSGYRTTVDNVQIFVNGLAAKPQVRKNRAMSPESMENVRKGRQRAAAAKRLLAMV